MWSSPREAFFEYLPYQINGFEYETLSKPIRKFEKIEKYEKIEKRQAHFPPRSLRPSLPTHSAPLPLSRQVIWGSP